MGNQKKQRDLKEILYALVFRGVETENISCQAGIYIYIYPVQNLAPAGSEATQ